MNSNSTYEDPPTLPIDELPPRIRTVVIRLDEDIAKISMYLQGVKVAPDQLNRYQSHLNKLIARRAQYVNWWNQRSSKVL